MVAQASACELPHADLLRANFEAADLRNSVLTGCNLEYATLRSANFRGANLANADLERADLRDIRWNDIQSVKAANLHGVRNAPQAFLDWALHHGAVATPGEE